MQQIIDINNLTIKNNQGEEILSNLSFQVEKNFTTKIIIKEPTLMKSFTEVLGAFSLPDNGTVTIDGLSTTFVENYWQIRKICSGIFQKPEDQLIGPTVYEEIAFVLNNIFININNIDNEINKILELTNLTKEKHIHISNLSSSQKRRLALASALSIKPKIIILSDWTQHLEINDHKEIIHILENYRISNELTIISIEKNNLPFFKFDKCLFMENGNVLFNPPTENSYFSTDDQTNMEDEKKEPIDSNSSKTFISNFSFSFGKYKHANTLFHKANPVFKLLSFVIFTCIIFMSKKLVSLIPFFILVFLSLAVLKPKFKDYKSIFRISKIVVYFSLLTMLFLPSTEYIYKFYFLTFSVQNIIYAITLIVKTFLVLNMFFVFSSTTPITSVIKYFEKADFLVISKKLKLKDISLIFLMTLNFIPLIFDEFLKLRNLNQTSNPQSKYPLKTYLNIIPRLFFATINKAQTLSMAIDCKCYGMPSKYKRNY